MTIFFMGISSHGTLCFVTCQGLGNKCSQWSTCHVILRTWVQYPDHTGKVLSIVVCSGNPSAKRPVRIQGLRAGQPPYCASSRPVGDAIWNTKVDGQHLWNSLRMSLSFYICWHIYAYVPILMDEHHTQTYMDTDMNMIVDTDMDTSQWVKEPNL